MLPSDHGHPWANRLVQLPPPLLSAIRATPDGPRKVVTLVRYYAMEYGGAMKDILTAEDEKYLAQHAHSGMTREDVIMLKLLKEKLKREGWEKGLKEGYQEGYQEGFREGLQESLQLRITYTEGLLNQGISWETIGMITGVDEAGLHQLREKLDRLQSNFNSDVEMDRNRHGGHDENDNQRNRHSTK